MDNYASGMSSPTTRTLKLLRDEGWPVVEVVEHWNAFAHIRQDLFGFVDVLACGPDGVLAVQTTSRNNMASRRNKILEHPNYPAVQAAGISIVVHGWWQEDGKGSRWRVKTEAIHENTRAFLPPARSSAAQSL